MARKRVLRVVGLVLTVCFLLVWFVAFRPQSLGGRAEYVGVSGLSMTPTLHNGDLAIVQKQDRYQRGNIIAYRIPSGQAGAGIEIIHRIVGGNGTTGFITKGDNNGFTDAFWHPTIRDVVGRVWFHVPHVITVMTYLRSPLGFAVLASVVTFAIVWSATKPREDAYPNSELTPIPEWRPPS